MGPETRLVFDADRAGGGWAISRARLSFAIGGQEAWWREALPALTHGAAMLALDRIAHGRTAHAVLDVAHPELAALLHEVANRSLFAEVVDVLERTRALATDDDAADPHEGLSYRVTVAPAGHKVPKAHALPVPPCCARAAGASSSGLHQLTALVAREGTGPLLPHAVLALAGLSPLGHVPCSLSCAGSLEAVGHDIARAESMGLADAVRAWRAFPQRQVHASVVGHMLEVQTDGFRFSLALPAAARHRVFPLVPAGATPPPAILAQALPPMDVAQHSRSRAVAWENARSLRTETRVAHYPCGDGYLLDAIHALRPAVHSLGFGSTPGAVAQARALLQGRNAQVVLLDAGNAAPVAGTLFIEAQALLAAQPAQRERLLGWMRLSRRAVLVGDAASLAAHGGMDALARACGVPVAAGRPGRISAEMALPGQAPPS